MLRHIKRTDVDSIWRNFNEVIDEQPEKLYLPTFNKVLLEYERINWFHELEEAENLCLVAEDPDLKGPDNVIGQCTIEDIQWEASKHVAVLGIVIAKAYRNVGLGKELIQFAINEAKKHEKKKIILSTFATNQAGIHLYEKLGFQQVGLHKKQFFMFNQYIDEINMELWIDDFE